MIKSGLFDCGEGLSVIKAWADRNLLVRLDWRTLLNPWTGFHLVTRQLSQQETHLCVHLAWLSHYCHHHQGQIFIDFEDNDNDDDDGDDDAAAAKDDDDNNVDNVECLEGGAPIFTGVTRQRSKLPTFVGGCRGKQILLLLLIFSILIVFIVNPLLLSIIKFTNISLVRLILIITISITSTLLNTARVLMMTHTIYSSFHISSLTLFVKQHNCSALFNDARARCLGRNCILTQPNNRWRHRIFPKSYATLADALPAENPIFLHFLQRVAIWAIIKVAGTCELNSHLGGRRLCQWERFRRIRLLKNNESHWCWSCSTQLLAKREIFHFSMLLNVIVERHHHYHHEIWRREAMVGLAGAVAVGWLEHAAIRVFPQILYSSIS